MGIVEAIHHRIVRVRLKQAVPDAERYMTHMGKLNRDNFRKTIYYLKKNGLKNTFYAICERMQKKETDGYTYIVPSAEILQKQRACEWREPVCFSIIVPLYHTPEKYLRELIESVLAQTYPYWQLVLADASEKDDLRGIVESYKDSRICYKKLAENKGIAENTNAGLEYATGDYIALLDHDDLLTPDALYEMAAAVKEGKETGTELQMLYSDEDKCDGEGKVFYEPHYKQDFNLDLLLTNNYICHFTAVKAELFRELKLRGEYNGAQDFDLVLRVADRLYHEPEKIKHIDKVLYHWRCHTGSTAANPASKSYAYEAGKRAVEAFLRKRGWKAEVSHLKHLGFYRVEYRENIFKQRPEIGAVGGKILDNRKKVSGGMMAENGTIVFEGLAEGFSGYMNRAVLSQQAQALDVRCFCLNPACYELFEESLGLPYKVLPGGREGQFDFRELPETKRLELSLKISRVLRERGYLLIWDPEWVER